MQVGDVLSPAALVSERWFAAPAKPIQSITVVERFDFPTGGAVAIVQVDVEGGRHLWRSMPIETAYGQGPWRGLLDLAINGGSLSGTSGWHLMGRRRVRESSI